MPGKLLVFVLLSFRVWRLKKEGWMWVLVVGAVSGSTCLAGVATVRITATTAFRGRSAGIHLVDG